MRAFITLLCSLAGWRRNAVAYMLGVCATLTLAPFFIFPLLIPAFSGLLLLLGGAPSRRRAFWDGWWWGWGFYMTGLYWFCIALLTDPEKFAWLIPFTLLGLMGVIAIYSGIACWIMASLRVSGLTKIFVFSVIWTCVEYARGHLFSGFPWNLPGYSFGFCDAALQLASVFGVYGLSWIAVLLGSSFAALFPIPLKGGGVFIAIIWVLTLAGIGWGEWRLHDAVVPDVPGVTLRLVQGNVAQPHKWDPKLQMEGLRQYARLTQQPGLEHVTHVIWPETAVPYPVKPGEPLARMLGRAVPAGTLLITGALRAQGADNDWQVWNSLLAIDSNGTIAGSYDKAKLVPFGEFLPFRFLFPPSWLTPVGDTDFSRGPGPQTVDWPGLPPLSPLICYEVIFPERAVDETRRPQLLLNVTNDAWFGMSTGPHQHFEMARMRAVEQGLPLVRVANTGITAVIDPFGRVTASLALGEQGVLDVKLPQALPKPMLYATYRYYTNIFLLLLIFVAFVLIKKQQSARR